MSCRIIFRGFLCECFCWSFVPNYLPAGALFYVLVAGYLPHSLFPHMLHLSHRFPRLSCPFLSLPGSDFFPLSPFSIVPFYFSLFFFSVLLHLPGLSPPPQRLRVFVIVCQVLDIQWGWPTRVFAAAVRLQKGHFGERSCCLLATLYA